MKARAITLLFAAILVINRSLSYADTDTPPKKLEGKIRGVCVIVEGPTNPAPSSCANTLLILNDAGGNEVDRIRTTAQGEFEFSAEPGKTYRIASGSHFYEVVAPKSQVRSGDQFLLKLEQK